MMEEGKRAGQRGKDYLPGIFPFRPPGVAFPDPFVEGEVPEE